MTRAGPPAPPGADVVAAFGLAGRPRLLPGGQGGTFAVTGGVLKPSTAPEVDHWIATLMADLRPERLRVPRPLAGSGSYLVEGWTAWELVEGEHRLCGGPWPDAIDVADRFSAALRLVDRPLPEIPDSAYKLADRMAWDDDPPSWTGPGSRLLDRLQSGKLPVTAPVQLVHGDLAGNILWHDVLPPAVIDLSPYRRPARYAAALVGVDAILWHGAGPALVGAADPQLVLRALMFRLVCDDLIIDSARGAGPAGRWGAADVRSDIDHAEPLVAWLEARLPGWGP